MMKKKKRSSFFLGTEIVALVLLVAVLVAAFGTDRVQNEADKAEYPKRYADAVELASLEFGISENLLYAIIKAESDFRADAVSRAGAVGLMQIMPKTFEEDIKPKLGIQKSAAEALKNYMLNVRSGAYYFSYLYDYCGDIETALAMYNTGIGTVRSWLKDKKYSKNGRELIVDNIPYEETRTYVLRVMYYFERYNDIYGKDKLKAVEEPTLEKYGVNVKWLTRKDEKGRTLVNELACYAWALRYHETYTDVDPIFVMAIIKAESDFVVGAVSKSNAYGLMQILEDTYNGDIKPILKTDKSFSYLLKDPEFAVKCGMCYLHWLYAPSRKLGGSMTNVAAAYNGGCGNARVWLATEGLSQNGVLIADKIPREETRNYVKKVMGNYEYYKEYLGNIFTNAN
ncbi:MAG: lytic transglycosylase domain-containing protein [Clostridia bacterium]|nr:lytic transglycosylase domain-containing protein [Clostridia bacterium]